MWLATTTDVRWKLSTPMTLLRPLKLCAYQYQNKMTHFWKWVTYQLGHLPTFVMLTDFCSGESVVNLSHIFQSAILCVCVTIWNWSTHTAYLLHLCYVTCPHHISTCPISKIQSSWFDPWVGFEGVHLRQTMTNVKISGNYHPLFATFENCGYYLPNS